MITTTVREQGLKLPIGVQKGNTLIKDFALRPHIAQTDRLLNIWREANKGKHIGWEVCKYLSLIVQSVGEESFPLDDKGDSPPESLVRLQQLSFGDVMHIWLCARIAAVEEKCEIPFVCSRCGFHGRAVVDLRDTEVVALESVKETENWVQLRHGVTLEDGRKAMKICIKPVPFSAIMLPGGTAESTDSLGYSQLRECTARIEGAQPNYILKDDEMDTIPRMDWLRIDRVAGEVSGGPKMRTAITCEELTRVTESGDAETCGNVMDRALDWSYDSFFDSSVPLASLTS